MANALALQGSRLPLQSAVGTMPAPPPVEPAGVAQPKANALSVPSPYMQPQKKPQNALVGATLDAFQRGFDPAARQARLDQSKADGVEKAKQTLALMQQQRALPEAQRAQWWTTNAPQIGQIIGQDLTQQPVDPSKFTDQALDGQIAMLSGQLGIAPATPDPMSEYEAAKIKLEQEEAARGPKAAIYNTPNGLVEAAPGVDPKLVYETKPEEKPPWQGAVKGPDGQWGWDPNYIKGYRQLHPQQPSGASARYENVSPEQMEALGYPKGTIGQRNVVTNQIEVKSRPSTQQTGQPTESERSAGLHATVSINGLRNLMAQEAGGYNRAGVQEQAAGFVGGENERLYDQAADEFIDGYLRAMTGAAATKTEIDTYRKQWFPTWGDTAPVIRQKAVGRLNALKGMKSKAGRAWHPEWDTMIASLEQQLAAPQAAEGPKFPDGTPITAETLQQLPPNLRAIYSRMLPQEDDDTALNAHIDSLFPADDGVDQGPIVGQVEDGFRFVGGDPGDPNNWEPVQ